MSMNIWKKVPDDELVKWLSTAAYLIYKNSNPQIVVYQHQVTRLYKVCLVNDSGFELATQLNRQELTEYFES